DGESLESYYSRFYKMMNELIRNQCNVTSHQVNVQFLLQLQPEWQSLSSSKSSYSLHSEFLNQITTSCYQNIGKAIVNSQQPIYDQEPFMVAKDDEASKDKEIDKLMALISLSFKKIYKPTKNNLRTSSNTTYHREKMLLCKQEEAGIQLNAEQADWRDDTDDDEFEDQELEAHYMYMA
nr:hypothetical protein [Tanacetum cinerariifolium]